MIQEKAYAKVNLFLNVLEKRKDGYHNLEMLNVKVDLYDVLEFKIIDLAETVIIKSNDLFLSSQENIVIQVAKYMLKTYKIRTGIEIKIDKKIPFGAGLAGNSADSAAVIKGINELFSLNLSLKTMKEIGLMYGADIPYCLTDSPAFVSGVGDEIEAIKLDLAKYRLLLVNPCEYISTRDVFALGDKSNYIIKDINVIKENIKDKKIEDLITNLHNSLEDIVTKNFEVMNNFRDMLINELGSFGLVMTGSGSSFIKIITENDDFSEFIAKYKDKYLVKIHKFL
ncbi:MAG: 4-(cytidine 5'-diphospho)-2-C-methyl-D-erythritol kinase [Candidatus Izemoplasmatales bacterium]|nr:4-(cytidine 5'-diphospho)-2-C-methyl-D-erythritol kinase [Candidatus Izemoplasmatales bacterium]